ncbi:GGDEF domain-containing protein [Bradyrhizobium sp. BR 1432]|uniref:GGDEF domain-containing protein n=1 Tax=Bradyrhizobium sp. BR 1432 TaxID=3447966 RepID=UPI003EE78489
MLLVDVDHFKKFNDHYGHRPATPACARWRGSSPRRSAGRPISPRYDGEEFGLLLPTTDADGGELVGENVRRALRDLGMLLALNLPSKIVTVSLDGATNMLSEGAMDCGSLVAAADRALYSAKDSGRDRLVMSGQVVTWPGAKSA